LAQSPPKRPAGGQPPGPRRLIAENRKARFDYEILDKIEAGLVLVGSEVKTLRGGNGNLAEAWVAFENDEMWLVDCFIPPYPQAGPFQNHEPRRRRKLLLKAAEVEKWRSRAVEKGLTAIPLQLYFQGKWIKVELGLGRGRKLHDKRAAIKERDDRREIRRGLNER
jgi:SsrA-binding protein